MPTRPVWHCPKPLWTTRFSSLVPPNRERMAPPVWAALCWQPRTAILCWTTRLMLACRLCSNNNSPRSESACLACARPGVPLVQSHPSLPDPSEISHHRNPCSGTGLLWESFTFVSFVFVCLDLFHSDCMYSAIILYTVLCFTP